MWKAFSRKNLWENLPPAWKRRVGSVVSCIPPALLLGRRFRSQLRFIKGAETWSADQAREYQLVQLRRVCTLAFEKTAYYRRVWSSIGFDPRDLKSLEDLTTLPMIDKDTVREHLDEMCTTSPHARGVDSVSTGGSGGVPLKFYIGAERSAIEYAHLVAGWQRVGYRLNIPQVVIRGQIVDDDGTGLRHSYDPLLRRHYYSNFHMNDENLRRYMEHIATIGPCYLHVYPSSALTLARFVQRTGAAFPQNIRGILAGSENVYPNDRAFVERTLRHRIFSWYGHSEKLVLAAECEHSNDYHIWPTYGYSEMIDEEGRPIRTPGQRGEIVGTGFMNNIMPFIRYRTGDYATIVGDGCDACGRRQTLIRDVLGHRTQEMLVAEDGALICWTAINMHDETFNNVRQFQFRQIRPGAATLRLVAAAGLNEADLQRIRHNLNRKLAGQISFEIELTDEIRLTPSGKSTYVDQRIDLEQVPQRSGMLT